jgi:hypothetical protein
VVNGRGTAASEHSPAGSEHERIDEQVKLIDQVAGP